MKKILRWIIRLSIVAIILFSIQISVLAYPQPLFSYHYQFENLDLYSDQELGSNPDDLLADVTARLNYFDSSSTNLQYDIYLCQSAKLYSLFAHLTFVPTSVQGFNLSLLNSTFVSKTRIDEVRIQNNGFPHYSAIEGNLAHDISHELIHQLCVNKFGFFNSRSIPRWKSEGIAEYGASAVVAKKESMGNLLNRINMVEYDSRWAYFPARLREYYRDGLIVFYLVEIEKLTIEQILDDSITRKSSLERLNKWYASQCEPTNI